MEPVPHFRAFLEYSIALNNLQHLVTVLPNVVSGTRIRGRPSPHSPRGGPSQPLVHILRLHGISGPCNGGGGMNAWVHALGGEECMGPCLLQSQ